MSEYIYGTDGDEGHWLTGEEIVRCRDCKHMRVIDLSGFYGNHDHDPMYCERDDDLSFYTYPDCFCSWGERKENE